MKKLLCLLFKDLLRGQVIILHISERADGRMIIDAEHEGVPEETLKKAAKVFHDHYYPGRDAFYKLVTGYDRMN